VFIVSSTYHEMVAPYAELLGVDDYFGVRLEVVDDRFTGRIDGPICHQENKAEVVQSLARDHGLDLSASWAFGDSTNDRFMLGCVGHPVAINPDRKLRRLARSQGWAIERWGAQVG
jgi:HAD superfamily hydrolase (TIGR01490 family)